MWWGSASLNQGRTERCARTAVTIPPPVDTVGTAEPPRPHVRRPVARLPRQCVARKHVAHPQPPAACDTPPIADGIPWSRRHPATLPAVGRPLAADRAAPVVPDSPDCWPAAEPRKVPLAHGAPVATDATPAAPRRSLGPHIVATPSGLTVPRLGSPDALATPHGAAGRWLPATLWPVRDVSRASDAPHVAGS